MGNKATHFGSDFLLHSDVVTNRLALNHWRLSKSMQRCVILMNIIPIMSYFKVWNWP